MNKSDRLDELLTIAIREVILEDWEAMTSAQGIQPVSRRCGDRMERILSGKAKKRGTVGKIGIGILVALTAFALLGMAIPPVREAIVRVFFTWQDTDYGVMKLGDNDAFIQVVGSRVYCCNTETGQLGSYPREASEEPVFREAAVLDPAETPEAMFADGKGFVIAYRDRLLLFDEAGNSVGETENALFDPSATYNRFSVCKNGDFVLLGAVHVYGTGMQAEYRGVLMTWDPETAAVKVLPVEAYSLTDIEGIAAENGRFTLIARAYDLPDTLLRLNFDPGSGKLTEKAQYYENGRYTVYGGSVYEFQQFVPAYQFFRLEETDGSARTIKNIRPEFLYEEINRTLGTSDSAFVTDAVFFDERGLALVDTAHQAVQLFSSEPVPPSERLTVLYPARLNKDLDGYPKIGDVQAAFMEFEERENCLVDAKGVSASRFTDYLRLNLLAGDAAFDVIHEDKCDEGDLFYAILRYGLYLPLEEQEGIVKNYENFAGGVKEYMTRDGHLIGIPFRFQTTGFVVTPAYQDSSLSVPDLGWTLEDFWNICEEARPLVNGGTALTEDFYLSWIFEALIQSGMEKGWLEEDAFVSAARKLTEYSACGVIRPFDVNMTYLLENRLHIPAVEREYAMVDVAKALPLPLVDGERFCPLSSFVWAYRDAGNPTLAVRYLEMLSSDDYIYEANDRTLYGSDPDRFFKTTLAMVGQIGMTERIGMEFTERDRLLLSKTSELMSGQKLEILDHKEAEDVIRPILDKMFAGELSAEDAAKEIVRYAKRRYFE